MSVPQFLAGSICVGGILGDVMVQQFLYPALLVREWCLILGLSWERGSAVRIQRMLLQTIYGTQVLLLYSKYEGSGQEGVIIVITQGHTGHI